MFYFTHQQSILSWLAKSKRYQSLSPECLLPPVKSTSESNRGFHNLFLISIFQINIQIWVCCSQNILTWCFKMTKKQNNVSLFDYSSLLLYLSLMPGRLMNSSYCSYSLVLVTDLWATDDWWLMNWPLFRVWYLSLQFHCFTIFKNPPNVCSLESHHQPQKNNYCVMFVS